LAKEKPGSANLSYFRLLGLGQTANLDDVKRAFRKKALELHPDVAADDSRSHSQFILVRHAYESLLDEASASEVRGYGETSPSLRENPKGARQAPKKEREPHYFDNDLNSILWDFEAFVLDPSTSREILGGVLDFLTFLDKAVLGPSGFPCFPISGTPYGTQNPRDYLSLLLKPNPRLRLPYNDAKHYYYDVRDRVWTFLLSLDKDVLAGDLERKFMARVASKKGEILQAIGTAQNLAFHYFATFRREPGAPPNP